MTVQASDPRSGWFRFLHHRTPLEWSNNVDERLAYIQKEKPPHEVGGRLAAIIRIPDDAVPLALREAWRAYEEAGWVRAEAGRAYEEAGRAYEEAGRVREEAWPYEEAGRVHGEAWRAYEEAGRVRAEAGRAYAEAGRAYNTTDFVLQFGPLPEGVTWNGKELIFACGQEEPPA